MAKTEKDVRRFLAGEPRAPAVVTAASTVTETPEEERARRHREREETGPGLTGRGTNTEQGIRAFLNLDISPDLAADVTAVARRPLARPIDHYASEKLGLMRPVPPTVPAADRPVPQVMAADATAVGPQRRGAPASWPTLSADTDSPLSRAIGQRLLGEDIEALEKFRASPPIAKDVSRIAAGVARGPFVGAIPRLLGVDPEQQARIDPDGSILRGVGTLVSVAAEIAATKQIAGIVAPLAGTGRLRAGLELIAETKGGSAGRRAVRGTLEGIPTDIGFGLLEPNLSVAESVALGSGIGAAGEVLLPPLFSAFNQLPFLGGLRRAGDAPSPPPRDPTGVPLLKPEAALGDIKRAAATTVEGGTPEASVRARTTALNNIAGDRFALREQDLAGLGVDVNDPEAYAGFLRDQVQRQSQNPEAPRTPDIRGLYVRPEWMHASRDKLKELALTGAARLRPDGQSARARFWYEDGKLALETLVPNEKFDQFVKFFATFSQNTDPRQNFFEALREWNNVQRGLPVSGVLGGKKSKAALVLAGKELDTPKIWSFANNLLGSEDHPTIDLWMWRMLDDTTPAPKASVPGDKEGLRYAQAREELREIAAELTAETGDTWTAAQVQAATWVEYRDRWSVATGGQPLGNDSFLDLMDETIARVAALEPTMRVVGEMMPSPESRRLMAPQDVPGGIQGAPIDTRVRYAEARLKAARRILTKLFRDLGIESEVGGALGVQGAVSKAVRPAVKGGVKATIGGTWAGKWNTNVPFRMPGDIEPWKRDIVLAVMGDLFEQDALPWDLFRPNDLAALKKIENLRPGNALPKGVDGNVSGIRVVTKEHLSPADGDALAAHLTDVLDDVNFTQDGDVLSFGEFSFSKTPKEFWKEVRGALASFEDGRFFDELANKSDLIYARFDGDLIGETYGSGQWQDLYDKALKLAPGGDPVRAAFPPDLLRTNRGKVRKKFASIDTRFRAELKRIQAAEAAGAVEDPRVAGPALRAGVAEGRAGDPGAGGARAGVDPGTATDEAARLARARDQGFTEELFHGTDRDFGTFEVDRSGQSTGHPASRLGVFTAPPEVASGFPRQPTGPQRVVPLLVRLRNPFKMPLDDFFAITRQTPTAEVDALRERLVREGFDGIEIIPPAAGSDIPVSLREEIGTKIIFDPANVRSRFDPFTAPETITGTAPAAKPRIGPPPAQDVDLARAAEAFNVTGSIRAEGGDLSEAARRFNERRRAVSELIGSTP